MTDAIGWTATTVFALSYFARTPVAMRRTQALAAGLWLAYGILMKAPPVIVANVIVATLALVSSFRGDGSMTAAADAPAPVSEPVRS